jgi:hypothetical protein
MNGFSLPPTLLGLALLEPDVSLANVLHSDVSSMILDY